MPGSDKGSPSKPKGRPQGDSQPAANRDEHLSKSIKVDPWPTGRPGKGPKNDDK